MLARKTVSMKTLCEEHSSKIYIQRKHLLISRMVISKEDTLFKIRPKPKVNVQLCWISLFSKSSWIKTTVSGLSYELGVNSEKKVNGNWDIINKN